MNRHAIVDELRAHLRGQVLANLRYEAIGHVPADFQAAVARAVDRAIADLGAELVRAAARDEHDQDDDQEETHAARPYDPDRFKRRF